MPLGEEDRPGDSELEWLESLFQSKCDGKWEHRLGIKIESIDNPGWWVTINVEQEHIEGLDCDQEVVLAVLGEPPSASNGNVGGPDWMRCTVAKGVFEGAGTPRRLRDIIRCFRELVSTSSSRTGNSGT